MIQTVINKPSKLILKYDITHFASGIIMIQFQTYKKWIKYFHRNNSVFYEFSDIGMKLEEIEIPDIFGDNNGYLPTSIQEKNFIYWYYIPYELIQK